MTDTSSPSRTNAKKTGVQRNSLLKLVVVAGFVLVLDQATKLIILHTLPLNGEIVVIPGCFNIVHLLNPGGAFGFLAGSGGNFRHIFFLIVSVLALGLVFYFYRLTPGRYRFLSMGFALIFGGAMGNLMDRLRFGQVVDFLDVYVNHWPAFNAADSAISIGIAIFVFHMLFGKMPDEMAGKR